MRSIWSSQSQNKWVIAHGSGDLFLSTAFIWGHPAPRRTRHQSWYGCSLAPLLDLFAALLTSKQWQPARSCSLFHGKVSWRFQQAVGWFCLIGDAASFNFCKASLAFLAHSGPGSWKRLYQSSAHVLVVVKNGHPDAEEASVQGDSDYKSSDAV